MATTAALAASAIRKELKATFAGVRFRVVCRNFSQGNAVDVHWQDGPERSEIEELLEKYKWSKTPQGDLPRVRFVDTIRNGRY